MYTYSILVHFLITIKHSKIKHCIKSNTDYRGTSVHKLYKLKHIKHSIRKVFLIFIAKLVETYKNRETRHEYIPTKNNHKNKIKVLVLS